MARSRQIEDGGGEPAGGGEVADAAARFGSRQSPQSGDLGAPVEIRNQARVHLWYPARFGAPCAPIPSSAAAIGRFLIHSTCVGMRPTPGGDVAVHAPFGLGDTFAGILRPNRRAGTAALAARKAAGYQARWPWLRYCPRAV